jgi:hypothetical protein
LKQHRSRLGDGGPQHRTELPDADPRGSLSASFHRGRGLFNGIEDAGVRAAAAEVVVHLADDLFASRPRGLQQQSVRVKDHPGRAETALKGVMLQKRFLDRMQPLPYG